MNNLDKGFKKIKEMIAKDTKLTNKQKKEYWEAIKKTTLKITSKKY